MTVLGSYSSAVNAFSEVVSHLSSSRDRRVIQTPARTSISLVSTASLNKAVKARDYVNQRLANWGDVTASFYPHQELRYANNLIDAGMAGLASIGSDLSNLRSLAGAAMAPLLSASNRSALVQEANALLISIDGTARTAQNHGSALLDGSFTGRTFQTGSHEDVDTISVSISDAYTLDGLDLYNVDISTVDNATYSAGVADAALRKVSAALVELNEKKSRIASQTQTESWAVRRRYEASQMAPTVDFVSQKKTILQQQASRLVLSYLGGNVGLRRASISVKV